jgi:ribonuclease VapC
MADAVLDSSAVFAVLQNEPGAHAVMAVLENAVVSAVNYAEIVGKLIERGATLEEAQGALNAIDLQVVAYDEGLAERTGELVHATRRLGISLGDRACIALAERERAPAYTSDRRWSQIPCIADIRLIR